MRLVTRLYSFSTRSQYLVRGFPVTWSESQIKDSLNLQQEVQVMLVKSSLQGHQVNSGKFIISSSSSLESLLALQGQSHSLTNQLIQVDSIEEDLGA